MKRCVLLLVTLAMLGLLSVTPTSARPFPIPDSADTYALFQGWLDNELIWFTGFETNNIRLAMSPLFFDFFRDDDFRPDAYHFPQFAPKLTSALTPDPTSGLAAARPMYVVLNFNQGAVLSTRPDNADYSGLWQIFYVQWLPGVPPRPITNDSAPGTDPQGLPFPSEAVIIPTGIVFNCPVIAIGRLIQPPLTPPPGTYRIPQVLAFDLTRAVKRVFLPRYFVWFRDPVSLHTWTASMPITDASSPGLADLLKANLAPGLLNMPLDDTQVFWWFNPPYPVLCQRPLMSSGPSTDARPGATFLLARDLNRNLDYSPIMIYTLLDRNIPQYVTVSSVQFLEMLLGSGALTVAANTDRFNGHASFVDDERRQ